MTKGFLYATVFIAGMSVMAVELTASRLLAPYFGASLFVWANLIGVVLVALSMGYYWGGKRADRNKGQGARRDLFLFILGTGILVGAIPWIAGPVFRFAYGLAPRTGLFIFFPSLISILVLFTVPLVFLGMVAPLAARVGIREINSAGRIVGSLYAVSTAGSVVGTFLPVFVTIPLWGSRETFCLFGILLILLGGAGLKKWALPALLCLPLVWTLAVPKGHGRPDIEFERESVYNLVRVRKLPKDFRALIVNEGIGAQSVYHPVRVLTGLYWDGAALLPLLRPTGKNFLFIGLAGGTSARAVNYFFPDLELEGVEIDPVIVEAGRKFLGLGRIPIAVHTGDGRAFLEETEKEYDFIMVDVYHDNLFIPFHMATREFFETVRRRLALQGAMVMNVFSPRGETDMLRLIKNTVTSVFPFVYEYRVKDLGSLLYAFPERPEPDRALAQGANRDLKNLALKILGEWKPVLPDPGGTVSRDDKPLIEILSAKSIFLDLPRVKPLSFEEPRGAQAPGNSD